MGPQPTGIWSARFEIAGYKSLGHGPALCIPRCQTSKRGVVLARRWLPTSLTTLGTGDLTPPRKNLPARVAHISAPLAEHECVEFAVIVK